MLGWGFFILIMGLVSCVLALQPYQPKSVVLSVFLSFLLLSSSALSLGPIEKNNLPEKVKAIAYIPVLKESPDFQYAARMYLK